MLWTYLLPMSALAAPPPSHPDDIWTGADVAPVPAPEEEAETEAPPAPAPIERPPVVGSEVELPEPRQRRRPGDDDGVRMRYELGVRARYISAPNGLLDLWFTDSAVPGWPTGAGERPAVLGASYGLEFLFFRGRTVGTIYVEALQSLVGEGYWDDTDNPNVFWDGDWLRPSPFFGGVIVGANGAYHAPIVKASQTQGKFTLDFVVGGGLGIVAVVGEMEKWTFDPTVLPAGRTAWERAISGEPSDYPADLKSPVWPVPDFELGLSFGFVDKGWIRIVGGLHGGLSLGGSAGGRF